jgi:hypothetical protein
MAVLIIITVVMCPVPGTALAQIGVSVEPFNPLLRVSTPQVEMAQK